MVCVVVCDGGLLVVCSSLWCFVVVCGDGL